MSPVRLRAGVQVGGRAAPPGGACQMAARVAHPRPHAWGWHPHGQSTPVARGPMVQVDALSEPPSSRYSPPLPANRYGKTLTGPGEIFHTCTIGIYTCSRFQCTCTRLVPTCASVTCTCAKLSPLVPVSPALVPTCTHLCHRHLHLCQCHLLLCQLVPTCAIVTNTCAIVTYTCANLSLLVAVSPALDVDVGLALNGQRAAKLWGKRWWPSTRQLAAHCNNVSITVQLCILKMVSQPSLQMLHFGASLACF